MFTGLVESSALVREVEQRGSGMRLRIAAPAPDGRCPDWRFQGGESVAVSGACLSIVAAEGARELGPRTALPDLVFDLSAETLQRTWFSALRAGMRVNLERALRLGDRLDGHLVAGHVDGQARVIALRDSGDGGRMLGFEVEHGLERYLIEKGSITLDGVSLTVVEPHARRFQVAAIALTLERTTLGALVLGQTVNVEADMIGKWIERLAQR